MVGEAEGGVAFAAESSIGGAVGLGGSGFDDGFGGGFFLGDVEAVGVDVVDVPGELGGGDGEGGDAVGFAFEGDLSGGDVDEGDFWEVSGDFELPGRRRLGRGRVGRVCVGRVWGGREYGGRGEEGGEHEFCIVSVTSLGGLGYGCEGVEHDGGGIFDGRDGVVAVGFCGGSHGRGGADHDVHADAGGGGSGGPGGFWSDRGVGAGGERLPAGERDFSVSGSGW